MQLSRTTLTPGDPHRDTVIVWTAAGGMDRPAIITTADGREWPLDRVRLAHTEDWNDAQVFGAFRVPPDVPSGAAELVVGGFVAPVTLLAPTRRPYKAAVVEPTGFSVLHVQHAFDHGRDVLLLPGDHRWPEAVRVTHPGTRLTGMAGARVVRSPNGVYQERCIVPADQLTVTGIRFDLPGLLIHADPPVTGLVVEACEAHGGHLGAWGCADTVVVRCRFRCGVPLAPAGLYLDCQFRDTPVGAEAFKIAGGSHALINCDFARTDRGPVWQLHGTTASTLAVNLTCRDITRGNNGNEILMTEGVGGELTDSVFLHVRASGCLSNYFQWPGGCRVHGNYVRDVALSGVGDVWLGGSADPADPGGLAEANTFDMMELSGVGVRVGPHARGNRIQQTACVAWRPSRQNQTYFHPVWYARQNAVWYDGGDPAANAVDVTVANPSA